MSKRSIEDRVTSLEWALTASEQDNVCACGHHGSAHDARNKCMACECLHFSVRRPARLPDLESAAREPAGAEAEEIDHDDEPWCVCGHLESDHLTGYCGHCLGTTEKGFSFYCDCKRFVPAPEPRGEVIDPDVKSVQWDTEKRYRIWCAVRDAVLDTYREETRMETKITSRVDFVLERIEAILEVRP